MSEDAASAGEGRYCRDLIVSQVEIAEARVGADYVAWDSVQVVCRDVKLLQLATFLNARLRWPFTNVIGSEIDRDGLFLVDLPERVLLDCLAAQVQPHLSLIGVDPVGLRLIVSDDCLGDQGGQLSGPRLNIPPILIFFICDAALRFVVPDSSLNVFIDVSIATHSVIPLLSVDSIGT